MIKKLICLLLISLGLISRSSAQSLEKDTIKMSGLTVFANGKSESINWQNISLEEAEKKAKGEKKYLLIYFTAKWCGPCRAMDQNVFPNYAVIRAVNDNYIAIKVDVDAWGGKKWVEKFGVRGMPDFFILNDSLQRKRHALGGMNTKKILEFLNLAIPPTDVKMLDTTFHQLAGEKWKHKIALTLGGGASEFSHLTDRHIFAYEAKLSLNIEKKRFLFSPGINFLHAGSALVPLNYLKFPAEAGINVYRGKIGGLAGGVRALAAAYYSRALNYQAHINKNDVGFDYGLGVYMGDSDRLSLELAIKGSQGLTDVLPLVFGKQTNQFYRLAITFAFRKN